MTSGHLLARQTQGTNVYYLKNTNRNNRNKQECPAERMELNHKDKQ